MHELKTKLRRRARPASPPRERRECSRRASREPSRPKRSEQTAGRARAPQTELGRPAPPRWEAPANCRRPSRSTFTARVSSPFPCSSVHGQVETYTGAGPSRNNVEQCLGVMVVQQTGVYCGFLRFMDRMIESRPVWDRASRARARQPRLLGVVLGSESVSGAVTTQAERADCRPRARASD